MKELDESIRGNAGLGINILSVTTVITALLFASPYLSAPIARQYTQRQKASQVSSLDRVLDKNDPKVNYKSAMQKAARLLDEQRSYQTNGK